MLTIACCDMQYEDETAYTLLSENMNVTMEGNSVPNVHFKDFITDKVKAIWNDVRKIYGDGDPSLPMVNSERTCLFHCPFE
jgi:hypothetical protein